MDEALDQDVKSSLGDIEALQDLDPNTIHSLNVVKNENEKAIYIALKKDGANFNYFAEKSKDSNEVFSVVEEQPEFPGGMNAMAEYLASEVKYPENAKNYKNVNK